jgi:hypothetical protein
VWIEALFKRIVDGVSGRGGVEAFCQYLAQIDFIKELVPLRHRMKANSIYFETALAKCNKEMLKRPLNIREEEIVTFMGAYCPFCHRETSLLIMSEHNGKCQCGGTLNITYVEETKKLISAYITPTPEVVMMNKAYDKIADAYCDTYKAFNLVLSKTAQVFNWGQFKLEDPQLRNYLDNFFLGRLAGEQQIPREEKQILQFIVRGNMAGVTLDQAEPLIRLGAQVVKYGYLYEVLGAAGALPYYQNMIVQYDKQYDSVNKVIRETLAEVEEKKHTTVQFAGSKGGYYAPCLIMPKACWETGKISKDIQLQPLYRLPVFAKVDEGALNLVFAPVGKGKTVLLSGIICYSYMSKNELIFVPLSDKSNSLTFAPIPLFAYDSRTSKLLHRLKHTLGVEPQGIPTVTLNVLRKGDKIKDLKKHPPTIFDRVIEIADPRNFEVDFNEIVKALQAISETEFGISKPAGLIVVRNLERTHDKDNINVDVQIASSLMAQFSSWRKSNLKQPARQVIDELSYLASSQNILYASDTLRSAATLSDGIKESRRDRVSIDAGTQDFLEIPPDMRIANTNIFFRELPSSKDKSRSPIDFLLHSLQLKDPSLRAVIRDLTERGAFAKDRYWFWYNKASRNIEVIYPCPPTFTLHDPRRTARDLWKLYEKHSNRKWLLNSWDDVAKLQAKDSAAPAKAKRKFGSTLVVKKWGK